MNSRVEGGQMSIPSMLNIEVAVNEWAENGEIEEICEDNDRYISYISSDGLIDVERRIYFPEKDNLDRIKEALIYDEEVKKYVNPEKVAEFIFNCIDVNALAVVNKIALIYDKENEDGDTVPNKAREQLMESVGGGGDEYAYEVGDNTLGIVWNEYSSVIINVGKIAEGSEELARTIAADMNYDNPEEDWKNEFLDIFSEAFTDTIVHEFRHVVYDINEFTELGSKGYPSNGGLEEKVEAYGKEEGERLRCDERSQPYVRDMFITEDMLKEKETPEKSSKKQMERE